MLKTVYKIIINTKVLFGLFTHSKSSKVSISYAGCVAWGIGGPRLKISKLSKRFPESFYQLNIIYCLSNSIYLFPSVLKLAKRFGVKIVVNQNGVYYKNWFKGDPRKPNSEINRILELADHVLFQSSFCQRAVQIHLRSKIGTSEILYNAVDCKIFRPVKKSSSHLYTFLVTGKIPSYQSYRVWIPVQALQILIQRGFDVKLCYYGQLSDLCEIQKRTKQIGMLDCVDFNGPYSEAEAPLIYSKCDCYISVTYMDNCPTAVMEAMASGLPVVYSMSGGVPEIVGPECGVGLEVGESWDIVNVPSAQTVADAMENVIKRHSQYSANARSRVEEKFSIDKWYIRHEELFDLLLK